MTPPVIGAACNCHPRSGLTTHTVLALELQHGLISTNIAGSCSSQCCVQDTMPMLEKLCHHLSQVWLVLTTPLGELSLSLSLSLSYYMKYLSSDELLKSWKVFRSLFVQFGRQHSHLKWKELERLFACKVDKFTRGPSAELYCFLVISLSGMEHSKLLSLCRTENRKNHEKHFVCSKD